MSRSDSKFEKLLRLLNPKVRRKLRAVRRGHAYANGFVPNSAGTYPEPVDIRNYRAGWQRDGEDWYARYCQRARLMKRDSRREQTLIVVDPQTGFVNLDESSAGHMEARKLVKEINLQIRLARKLGWSVIVLTYAGYGEIHPQVLGELQKAGDGSWHVLAKNQRSGAREVLKLCSETNISSSRFRIVGAYTNQCVQETVGDLVALSHGSQIEIVTRACWPNEFGYWTRFINTKNVLLLPAPVPMPTPLPSAKWWNLRALKNGIT